MEAVCESKQIIVVPQIFVSLTPDLKKGEASGERPCHADVAVAWSWDEASFRMDVSLPQAGALNIIFPLKADVVYVNGEIVWDGKGARKNGISTTAVEPDGAGLRLIFSAGGPYHILVRGLTEGKAI